MSDICAKLLLLVLIMVFTGCEPRLDTEQAALQKIARFEEDVELDKVHQWAKTILKSGNYQQEIELPDHVWKKKRLERVRAFIVHQANNEYFVNIYFRMGLEAVGLAFGRDEAVYTGRGFIYRYKPGIFYFYYRN